MNIMYVLKNIMDYMYNDLKLKVYQNHIVLNYTFFIIKKSNLDYLYCACFTNYILITFFFF